MALLLELPSMYSDRKMSVGVAADAGGDSVSSAKVVTRALATAMARRTRMKPPWWSRWTP